VLQSSTVPVPGSEEKQSMDVPNQMQESFTQTRGDAGIGLAGCHEPTSQVRLFPYTRVWRSFVVDLFEDIRVKHTSHALSTCTVKLGNTFAPQSQSTRECLFFFAQQLPESQTLVDADAVDFDGRFLLQCCQLLLVAHKSRGMARGLTVVANVMPIVRVQITAMVLR